MKLDDLVKTIEKDDFEILKKEFPDTWEYLINKMGVSC